MRWLCWLFLACSLLTGCADVAMSGAQAVYNRRSIQNNLSDNYAVLQAYRALHKDESTFAGTNINVTVFNNEILIAGQVPRPWQRVKASVLLKRETGITEVYNQLQVSNPTSSLTHLSDIWITTKVKAKLIASDDLEASLFKVVTENGTVYLMGIVPPSQADAAVEIARETEGVSKVVRVMKYVRICRV